MFARHHDLATMYFCESADGDRWIAAPVDDLVDRFRQAEVRQYLFIDHGWVAPGGDVVRRDQIKKHPEAFEAVLFKAEDETGIVRGTAAFIAGPRHSVRSTSTPRWRSQWTSRC